MKPKELGRLMHELYLREYPHATTPWNRLALETREKYVHMASVMLKELMIEKRAARAATAR